MRGCILLLGFLISATIRANQSSLNALYGDKNTSPIGKSSNEVPGDKVIPPLNGSQIDEMILKAREAWQNEQDKSKELSVSEQKNTEAEEKVMEPQFVSIPEPPKKITRTVKRPTTVRYHKPSGQEITVFKSNISKLREDVITLPSGSHAFGRVKFGEEVTAKGEAEVLVELDYAFLGPNQSVVELNGCVVWIRVHSNFHTQRVKGAMQDLTCTMTSGKVFTVSIGGPLVAVASGYSGVDSDLIMRGPAKAAALKFLSEITSAYGAATAAAQTTTDVVASETTSDRATNVTGDKNAYAKGKVLEAHGDFLKYVSSFFESMQPTLALPPGTKVHLVNRFNVQIPRAFFKKGGKNG